MLAVMNDGVDDIETAGIAAAIAGVDQKLVSARHAALDRVIPEFGRAAVIRIGRTRRRAALLLFE